MPATILLVEDEPAIQELIAFNLTQAGHHIVRADSAERAAALVKSALPDLILLDWMLPGASGIEFAKQLRANERTRTIPIIMLTARGDEQDKVVGLDAGADDYITKPIRPKVFVSKVKALLKRSGGDRPDGPIMEANGVTIDLEKVLVYANDQELQLPKKEFELLVLLMSKPGKVFKRDEIYSQVWGTELFVGERTIDVHIRKLREKIGDERIRTVKGVGYTFDA